MEIYRKIRFGCNFATLKSIMTCEKMKFLWNGNFSDFL